MLVPQAGVKLRDRPVCILNHSIDHLFDAHSAGAWLLESVEKMFNTARIPEPLCDTISELPHPSCREARSILLMVHDWCYSVVVYGPPPSDNPSAPLTLLPVGEIEAHLRAVVLDVESRLSNGEKALPVGVLSADERDRWAKVRSQTSVFLPGR